jgi:hypothetical protein
VPTGKKSPLFEKVVNDVKPQKASEYLLIGHVMTGYTFQKHIERHLVEKIRLLTTILEKKTGKKLVDSKEPLLPDLT